MNIGQRQNLQQKQNLTLTANLHQALSLLQFNAVELTQYVENEASVNPFLQVESPTVPMYKDSDTTVRKRHDDDEMYDPFATVCEEDISFSEALKQQVMMLSLTKKEHAILDFMIESLDERGYYTLDNLLLYKYFSVNDDDIEKIHGILCSLEPAGVGAKNIVECITLQLKRKSLFTQNTKIVLENYLEEIASGNLARISKKSNISMDEVKDIVEKIKACNPIPSNGYGKKENRYVSPDIIVQFEDGQIRYYLNDGLYPKVYMTENAKNICTKAEESGKWKHYLKEQYNRASSLVNAVEIRNMNLLRVTEEIFSAQDMFFETQKLRPLKLEDIAQRCNLSISTVCKLSNEKYVQTPVGVYPLSHFFVKQLPGMQDTSVMAAKEAIKDLIAQEDKSHPFSDEDLMRKLKEMNIILSRRTVAKYRESMMIPTSYKRKV